MMTHRKYVTLERLAMRDVIFRGPGLLDPVLPPSGSLGKNTWMLRTLDVDVTSLK